MAITELKQMRHLNTDLVEVARHIEGHDAAILICDERHIHVYTVDGTFSVEWVDWEYGGATNHAATAAVIEERLAN